MIFFNLSPDDGKIYILQEILFLYFPIDVKNNDLVILFIFLYQLRDNPKNIFFINSMKIIP